MNSLLRQYYDKIKVNYHVLSCNEITHVNHMIETKYIAPKSKFGFSLFDILKVEECVAVNYYDSWRWIYPFINKKSIIVFFDYNNGEYIELSDGGFFVDFFDECPKSEFYMIDSMGQFLLGYNHSKCLFAMGTAADWLERDEKYLEFYGIK